MIGGEELKIDLIEMDAILRCLVPTNVTRIRRFFGASYYLGIS
jgi:hypothetical protein